mmetsp:Transcript_8331/g.51939  ORF Transcript_8331/g.51939 Transcript_8331/m.51939 type:complete len:393 (-) Transcript_8331:49-1227(-)
MDGPARRTIILYADGARGAVGISRHPWIGMMDAKKGICLSELEGGGELLAKSKEVPLRIGAASHKPWHGPLAPTLGRDPSTSRESSRASFHHVDGQVDLGMINRAVFCRLRQQVDVVGESHGIDGIDVPLGLPDVVDGTRFGGDLSHDDFGLGFPFGGFSGLPVEELEVHFSHHRFGQFELCDPFLHVHVHDLSEDSVIFVPFVEGSYGFTKPREVECSSVLIAEGFFDVPLGECVGSVGHHTTQFLVGRDFHGEFHSISGVFGHRFALCEVSGGEDPIDVLLHFLQGVGEVGFGVECFFGHSFQFWRGSTYDHFAHEDPFVPFHVWVVLVVRTDVEAGTFAPRPHVCLFLAIRTPSIVPFLSFGLVFFLSLSAFFLPLLATTIRWQPRRTP